MYILSLKGKIRLRKLEKKTLEYSDLPGWKSISITFHEKMMGGVGGRGLGLGGGEKRLS